MSRNTGRSVMALLLAATVFMAFLGTRGLNEPDEGRYGEIGREMSLSSDWLVPHLNGVPHFQKPPMFYWWMATAIRVCGANEWAVRLPSALAALGTVAATMFIAGRLFGPVARWRSALILTSCAGFFVIARLATTDMLLTFWITLAIAGLVARQTGGGWPGVVVFYVAMGLGFLTKGPMALLVPCSAALGWRMSLRRAGQPRTRLYGLPGIVLALVIGLSWFLLVVRQYPELLQYFLGYEFVERLASNVHKRNKPFWFYPEVLSGGFMPWTPFLCIAGWMAWRARKTVRTWSGTGLFAGWVVFTLLVLSLVRSKLPTYLLPVLPPLSILLARAWEPLLATRAATWAIKGTALLMAVALLLAPAFVFAAEDQYACVISFPPWVLTTWVLSIVLFLLLRLLPSWERGKAASMPWLAGSILIVFVTGASQADVLMRGGNAHLRDIAAAIRSEPGDMPPEVFVCDVRGNGLEFYLGRLVARTESASDVIVTPDAALRGRLVENSTNQIAAMQGRPAFILVKADRAARDPVFAGWNVRARAGSCVLLQNHP